MENDGFLEFKWKGDQFLIFLHAAFALTRSQTLPPLCLSNGQRGPTGESEERETPPVLQSPER